MRSEEAKELDELLRAGLASYSFAEPRFGMEERILRSVLTQKTTRRVWWPWAAGAVATTGVLVAMMLLLTHSKTATAPSVARTPPSSQSFGVANSSHPEVAVVRSEMRAPREHSRGTAANPARITASSMTSDDDLFPSAGLLTQEEALVVEGVEMSPVVVSRALQEAKTRSLEPVRVAAIHIEPLQPDGARQEE